MGEQMTFELYRAIDAINASLLKACSFGAYQGYKHLHAPAYKSDAMDFGSAVHCALLEPDLFKERYLQIPMDAPTKLLKPIEEYKKPTEDHIARDAWWKNFESSNLGKIVLPPDEALKIELIRQRCDQIEAVKQALASFEKEKTIIFDDGKCKARLDLVDVTNGVVIDVKTTRDANPREFIKQLLSLRYDIQMLHYCKAVNATTAYAIAIESETAEVALYDLTDIVFSDFTKDRYENAFAVAIEVQKMQTCPPKFKPEIINLTLPAWVKESA